jgi:hypothetical protein
MNSQNAGSQGHYGKGNQEDRDMLKRTKTSETRVGGLTEYGSSDESDHKDSLFVPERRAGVDTGVHGDDPEIIHGHASEFNSSNSYVPQVSGSPTMEEDTSSQTSHVLETEDSPFDDFNRAVAYFNIDSNFATSGSLDEEIL